MAHAISRSSGVRQIRKRPRARHYSANIALPAPLHLPAKPEKPIIAAISGSRPPSSPPPAPPTAPFSRSSFCAAALRRARETHATARRAREAQPASRCDEGRAPFSAACALAGAAAAPPPPPPPSPRASRSLAVVQTKSACATVRLASASSANALGWTGAASSRFRLCSSNLACTSSSELRSTRIDMPSARISARRASATAPQGTSQAGAYAFCR